MNVVGEKGKKTLTRQIVLLSTTANSSVSWQESTRARVSERGAIEFCLMVSIVCIQCLAVGLALLLLLLRGNTLQVYHTARVVAHTNTLETHTHTLTSNIYFVYQQHGPFSQFDDHTTRERVEYVTLAAKTCFRMDTDTSTQHIPVLSRPMHIYIYLM